MKRGADGCVIIFVGGGFIRPDETCSEPAEGAGSMNRTSAGQGSNLN